MFLIMITINQKHMFQALVSLRLSLCHTHTHTHLPSSLLSFLYIWYYTLVLLPLIANDLRFQNCCFHEITSQISYAKRSSLSTMFFLCKYLAFSDCSHRSAGPITVSPTYFIRSLITFTFPLRAVNHISLCCCSPYGVSLTDFRSSPRRFRRIEYVFTVQTECLFPPYSLFECFSSLQKIYTTKNSLDRS